MDRDKKREYQLRISQANKTELTVILYEITIDYVDEALGLYEQGALEDYLRTMERVRDCVEELSANLHYEYELARNLKSIYLYMKKSIRTSIISKVPTNMDVVRRELDSLRQAYSSIAGTDTSGPVMVNTQAVLTGMTYGKDKVLSNLTLDCTGRGFLV